MNHFLSNLMREYERMATKELWPNFMPMAIPLAFFDGHNTYLFRYPGKPKGFEEMQADGVTFLCHKGRHPNVIASSNITIENIPTASVMMLQDQSHTDHTPSHIAALAIHEAFHVFQMQNHPTWLADVGPIFIYPFKNAKLLSLRRIETEALRRALTSPDEKEKLVWTHHALTARQKRYENMDATLHVFERTGELCEGLATYIEALALGHTKVNLPPKGYPADDIRGCFYKMGHALAILLDTFAPQWKTELETQDTLTLDAYLADAIKDKTKSHHNFTKKDIENFEITAKKDIQTLRLQRKERKKSFDTRPGTSIKIIAPCNAPMRINGTDPSNAKLIEGGILHTRYILLRHKDSKIEMLSDLNDTVEAFTTAAGIHPLFDGILQIEIRGLDKLDITKKPDATIVTGTGLTASFFDAHIEHNSSQTIVHLKE